ncbi:MAG: hypothetical protein O4861_16010 [Trichodesmium sp. St16_bin4-tuft]|nr:hypothetical protein [Trichodesmium sp. St4_bin8_1]MDE5071399.1 hypothetical protein [Trichodesmium sp. St5_bin8]MDE5078468.1 hypothetical protein [Trichodesmium sp. St2_bin6]MDE5092437.1 hypothetical protein [Trichodesmium sp. St18_bin3_1_1]MDE5099752.1 hypothetical protein [Trichodesmium sp. St16_bin4-tuft]MDE5104280.1 hypothetical protein [Trichodesmium sp. St19_bin2]
MGRNILVAGLAKSVYGGTVRLQGSKYMKVEALKEKDSTAQCYGLSAYLMNLPRENVRKQLNQIVYVLIYLLLSEASNYLK